LFAEYEAYTVWMKMLESDAPDYPEEAVRKILLNLISQGSEGLRKAKEVVSAYLERGNERPLAWLKEIQQDM
jgi:hypothetical protein